MKIALVQWIMWMWLTSFWTIHLLTKNKHWNRRTIEQIKIETHMNSLEILQDIFIFTLVSSSPSWNALFLVLVSLVRNWVHLLFVVEPTFSLVGEHCSSWGRRLLHLVQGRPIFPRGALLGFALHKRTRISGERRLSMRSPPPRSSPGPSFPLEVLHT